MSFSEDLENKVKKHMVYCVSGTRLLIFKNTDRINRVVLEHFGSLTSSVYLSRT